MQFEIKYAIIDKKYIGFYVPTERKEGITEVSIIEIIGGAVLLIACVLLIILGLMQDQKADQNMASAITGSAYDSQFSKNQGRTKEAILKRWTLWLAVVFFVATLVVTIVPVYL